MKILLQHYRPNIRCDLDGNARLFVSCESVKRGSGRAVACRNTASSSSSRRQLNSSSPKVAFSSLGDGGGLYLHERRAPKSSFHSHPTYLRVAAPHVIYIYIHRSPIKLSNKSSRVSMPRTWSVPL